MITGASLRSAREQANLTQREVATATSVSLRTVGNWERNAGGPVPQKYWQQIARLLPAAQVSQWSRGQATLLSDDDMVRMQGNRWWTSEAAERLTGRDYSPHEIAALHASIYEGGVRALDFAEDAMRAGADPQTIKTLVRAITHASSESGMVAVLSGIGQYDPTAQIVFRAAHIDDQADQNSREQEIVRSGRGLVNVTRDAEDDEADIEITNEVQSAYGRAAHQGPRKADEPHAE